MVSAAAVGAPVLVSLQRGGTIRGTVDPGPPGARMRPEIRLDAEPVGERKPDTYGRFSQPFTWADERGAFEFRGVRPGHYRVTSGGRSVEVTVVAGQAVEVALDEVESR